ncbi:hypothetical protein PPL_05747 [Heterostelium album PN500]|uniref:GPI inositol-deacylase n=1 Tax=Heterostelium pallidum (strain ATCC 26659 / Pp 5 / PN500) TaxID=670386 RepID=D3BB16_HETP5|nr:hypothetical protein PPL_05747 [Heterostelium album PN500]EFA81753.1 hypothetical protein PPL_05747 [Heterostelium album PN500]|eukprot:XP_020433870.1 hypothetical protein PPL_05747 [Heterostelium album PN500]
MALLSLSQHGKWFYLVAFNVVTVILFIVAIQSIFFDIDPNICTMTYMLPVYYSVSTNHSRYHLYLYRESHSVLPLSSLTKDNSNLNLVSTTDSTVVNNLLNSNNNNNNINSNNAAASSSSSGGSGNNGNANNNAGVSSTTLSTLNSNSNNNQNPIGGTTPNAPAYAGNTISRLGKPLRGVPVLFIPGNSGSYKQIRSIGAEAFAHINRRESSSNPFEIENPNKNKKKRKPQQEHYYNELDIFTLDFEEELSAFGGDVMFDEAEYVNDCIKVILDLYHNQPSDPDKAKPSSVILIGHSMGGIVARMSVLLPNHIYGSVTTIITLNTSHRNAPIYSHQSTSHFYHELNRHWSNSIQPKHFEFNEKGEPTNLPPIVISIGGGHRDTLIRSELTSLNGIVSAERSFSAITTSIPDVLMETDHQCILWCNEVVVSLVEGLLTLAHPLTKQNTYAPRERLEILRSQLHSHVPEILGFTPFVDQQRYMATMKQTIKIDTESLTDIAKKIDYETSPMVTLLHRPSLAYQYQANQRVTSSSSPVESFYIHFRISDWIHGQQQEDQMQSQQQQQQQNIGEPFNFALTTSLPLGEFTVVLYSQNYSVAEEISYKSFSFPPLPPLTKSNIESPVTQLVLQASELKDFHSIFIGFPKSARKQKFIAISQFYNTTESQVNVPSTGIFDVEKIVHKYTLPVGHSLVYNFSLPFYHKKYPLKVRLSPTQPKKQQSHDHHQSNVKPQTPNAPIFLPTTYQYIPGVMEEGKFVYNCSLTKIKFHQSSTPSKIKINNSGNQQPPPQQQQDNKRIVVESALEMESKQNTDQLQFVEINNHVVGETLEHNKMHMLLQESTEYEEIITDDTIDPELDVYEDVYVERPHLFMVLDPYISYEVTFTFDFFGSIGSMVFSYALSLFPSCYALFLWVFASQMNSWRKKDEFPNLLLTLREESVILAPFFILIPLFIYVVFNLIGYTNPSILSSRSLIPDPFIDSFMLEQIPPFWVIPFLFIFSVCIVRS